MRNWEEYVALVEEGLHRFLPPVAGLQQRVYEAMRYSTEAGGKRIRPVLCLAVCEALGTPAEQALPFACALEMIHTYSLIHDDLPCMDDDDYRRGRLTNHKMFGEATAVLAGDGLLTKAFEVAASASLSDTRIVAGIRALAQAAGTEGMIGGQMVDMLAETQEITPEELLYLHRHKTGALLRLSMTLGAIAAGADEDTRRAFEQYGDALGLAFQVRDDILDVIGDPELLGKPVGSDADSQKTTFVTSFGLERAEEMVQTYTQQAVDAVQKATDQPAFFISLAEKLASRMQ